MSWLNQVVGGTYHKLNSQPRNRSYDKKKGLGGGGVKREVVVNG